MNERIKQFAEQAKEYADSYDGKVTPTWYQMYNEKFAELIVQECVSLMNEQKECYSNPDMYEPNVHNYVRLAAKADAFNEAAYIIKNYFKVES